MNENIEPTNEQKKTDQTKNKKQKGFIWNH